MNSFWKFRVKRASAIFQAKDGRVCESSFILYFSLVRRDKHGRTAHITWPHHQNANVAYVLPHSVPSFLFVKTLNLTALQNLQLQTCTLCPLFQKEIVGLSLRVCHLLWGTKLSCIWLMFPTVDILSHYLPMGLLDLHGIWKPFLIYFGSGL